ncbi:MAG: alpha/beta fold hydrolase [Thiobacillus sp.]|nr:alpha/beta fold hydrolase [Thiobacillus sp.]
MHMTGHPNRLLARGALFPLLTVLLVLVQGCSSGPSLKPWHTEMLTEEFTAAMVEDGQVRNFDDYLALEGRLYEQLDDVIYARTERGPAHILERYSYGSAADPERRPVKWNHSFELPRQSAVGGVLLLHGMSDSPYTMRALGETLNQQGYHVIGLRLPGHGTVPSGLRHVTWQDMAAAVKLAMQHLASELGSKPLHIIGYSTGASLAMNYSLDALAAGGGPVPASLVLMSPAIRIHPASALAGFKDTLAGLPGLDGLAYLQVMDEFDPYKYNSFATNAGAQVHRVTTEVDRRMQALVRDAAAIERFPPILVLKSTVDSTVTTDAVVTHLLMGLPAGRNELVLFDINRNAAIKAKFLVDDPGPLTNRLMLDPELPFAVTFVGNENPYSTRIVARHKPPLSRETSDTEPLDLAWPSGVVSLSHVALPFPPDDPLYGQQPPANDSQVFLGDLAIKGERGLLKIPGEWLLRLRYNPFYAYMQTRVLKWLDDADSASLPAGMEFKSPLKQP